MTSAIIVAAGSSQRMGFDKLLAYIGPRQVIAHTLAAFDDCPDIDEIILITNDERFKAIERIEQEECFQKLTHIIHGGAERHHSVWNGLKDLNPNSKYVAVHDGARPLITPAQITRASTSPRSATRKTCTLPTPAASSPRPAPQKNLACASC